MSLILCTLECILEITQSLTNAKCTLKETVSKAMFALLSKGRVLQLPVDIMLEMFDKTVVPIMLYGCEVWVFGKNDMLDTVFPEIL